MRSASVIPTPSPLGYLLTHLAELQSRAVFRARVACRLAFGSQECADAFAAGLLCDAGLALSRPDHELLVEDSSVADARNAALAAYVLWMLGIPLPIIEALGFQSAPIRSVSSPLPLIEAVRVASALAREEVLDASTEASNDDRVASPAAPPASGRRPTDLERWRAVALEALRVLRRCGPTNLQPRLLQEKEECRRS